MLPFFIAESVRHWSGVHLSVCLSPLVAKNSMHGKTRAFPAYVSKSICLGADILVICISTFVNQYISFFSLLASFPFQNNNGCCSLDI